MGKVGLYIRTPWKNFELAESYMAVSTRAFSQGTALQLGTAPIGILSILCEKELLGIGVYYHIVSGAGTSNLISHYFVPIK